MQDEQAFNTEKSQQTAILERLQQSTKSQHLVTNSFSTELIRCSNNYESIMACTNQKCLSYPFICSETKKCQSCEQNHEHCMTFIKFEKLIHQISRKKNKPQQVIQFLNDWFSKFIDLLSDTLDQLEMSLNSYGLTKKEEQLLELMQTRKQDKITGSKLNQVLKQIDSIELLANSQQQLLQNIKRQVQSTMKILTTQLSSYTFIIDSARQGKLAHIKNSQQKPQSWKFDRSHKFAKNFQFQHNDKTIMKQMQRGKYAQAIGNQKFNRKKDSQFSVMINSTVDSCIMFGIGSKDCEREDAHYSDKGIFYWGYSGKIWEKGCSYRGADQPFASGDVITVRYSPDHKNVYWLKNHKVVASTWLPQKLLETQQLYPIFCILANGDKLTVFEDN